MAKLVVAIEIPMSYEDLHREVVESPRRGMEVDCWYTSSDDQRYGPGVVVVPEAYLQRSVEDDNFVVFEFVGVLPGDGSEAVLLSKKDFKGNFHEQDVDPVL